MMKRVFITGILFFAMLAVSAQSGLVTTGGDIQGSNGSVSYTVGQIAVQSLDGASATLSEGVQQPYEIQTIGVDNYPHIVLDAKVYPNPTADRLILKINDVETCHEASLQATLFTTHGQPIQTMDVAGEQTVINMTDVAAGTYYLRVTDGQQTLKTFKIIKTM